MKPKFVLCVFVFLWGFIVCLFVLFSLMAGPSNSNLVLCLCPSYIRALLLKSMTQNVSVYRQYEDCGSCSYQGGMIRLFEAFTWTLYINSRNSIKILIRESSNLPKPGCVVVAISLRLNRFVSCSWQVKLINHEYLMKWWLTQESYLSLFGDDCDNSFKLHISGCPKSTEYSFTLKRPEF